MTDLEKRIAELEKKLATMQPGSQEYGAIVADHASLVRTKLAIEEAESKRLVDDRRLDLEEERVDLEYEVEMTKAENGKRSLLKDMATIAAGTWIPMAGYMLWESRGNIFTGKSHNWIGKLPFRR